MKCAVCGTEITGERSSKKYCSIKCRQAAWALKHITISDKERLSYNDKEAPDGLSLYDIKERGHDLTLEEFVFVWNEYVKEYGWDWRTRTVEEQVALVYGGDASDLEWTEDGALVIKKRQ